jgi:hypothetical protein
VQDSAIRCICDYHSFWYQAFSPFLGERGELLGIWTVSVLSMYIYVDINIYRERIFLWDQGLISGLYTCKVGALLLESLCQPLFWLGIF